MARITAQEAGGQNIVAFLDMLAWSEGTDNGSQPTKQNGYDVMVGGALFTDLSKHPAKLVRLNPKLASTAAGRYQFLSRTGQPAEVARPAQLWAAEPGQGVHRADPRPQGAGRREGRPVRPSGGPVFEGMGQPAGRRLRPARAEPGEAARGLSEGQRQSGRERMSMEAQPSQDGRARISLGPVEKWIVDSFASFMIAGGYWLISSMQAVLQGPWPWPRMAAGPTPPG